MPSVSLSQEVYFLPERSFELTYAGSIDEIPKGAMAVKAWIPLAGTREGQEVLDRNIEVSVPFEIMREPKFGNEMIAIELNENIPDKIDFEVKYRARVSQENFKAENREDDLSKYLEPTSLMLINADVLRRVAETFSEPPTDSREQARLIFNHVFDSMQYDKEVPGWGKGDTARACALGKGNCTDFHSLFISMSMASQLPARFKIGFTVPRAESGDIKGYHCWAEYYDHKTGWGPVDISDAWKHPERKEGYFSNFDTNKFTMSVGRDIVLSDSQQSGPVNIFFYPHVEVDGEVHVSTPMRFEYSNK